MFFKPVLFLLFVVVCCFATIDSAGIVNAIAVGTAVGQQIAQGSGHGDLIAIIGGIGLAIANIFSFIWGHRRGKKSVIK